MPSRRALLRAAAAAPALSLAAACTRRRRVLPRPAGPDPDTALRAAAVDREVALLASYDALLAAQPALSPTLAPVRGEHLQHLTALGGRLPTTAASGLPGTVPALVAAERAAAAAHGTAAVAASTRLAPLLASLAASEACHPLALA